jgi:hypothetical protein
MPVGLRTARAKKHIDALRQSVADAYANGKIAECRMKILLGLLNSFEREAFLPWRRVEEEMNAEREYEKS